ncbi:MAG: hypothetical protein ABIH29_04540 [Candidatus Micrarchaeota archaeon]
MFDGGRIMDELKHQKFVAHTIQPRIRPNLKLAQKALSLLLPLISLNLTSCTTGPTTRSEVPTIGGKISENISVKRPTKSASLTGHLHFPTPEGYSPDIEIFVLDSKLQSLADSLSGTDNDMVKQLFSNLRTFDFIFPNISTLIRKRGGYSVFVRKMDKLPPRTAIQGFHEGGDCSELSRIAVAILKHKSIPGGVKIFMDKTPAERPMPLGHIVPYVILGEEEILFDLQGIQLGKTLPGPYTLMDSYSYEESAFEYHYEWGRYYFDRGDWEYSIAAFLRSIEICDRQPELNFLTLGHMLSYHGEYESSLRFFDRVTFEDTSWELPMRISKIRNLVRNRPPEKLNQAKLSDVEYAARRAFEQGNFDECSRIYSRILGRFPTEKRGRDWYEAKRGACALRTKHSNSLD